MSDTDDPQPFRFQDPREIQVHERLHLVSEGLASFFHDACRIKHLSPALATTVHVVTHLLREIDGGLLDALSGEPRRFREDDGQEKADCRGSSREGSDQGEVANERGGRTHKVKKVIQTLGIRDAGTLEEGWLAIGNKKQAGLEKLTHRRDLSTPRRADGSFEEVWDRVLAVWDHILAELEASFSVFIGRAEALAEVTHPAREHGRQLAVGIPQSPVILHHFFSEAVSPGWLTLRSTRGIVTRVPAAHRPAGFRDWPAAQYLERMARDKRAEKAVLSRLCELPDDIHGVTLAQVLDILAALPVDLAAALVPRVNGWLRSSGAFPVWDRLADLVICFVDSDSADAAFQLCRSFLKLESGGEPMPQGHPFAGSPPEPRAYVDDWQYEQFSQKVTPALVDGSAEKTIELLASTLDRGLKLKAGGQRLGEYADWSIVWRPQIEQPKRHASSPLDVLVTYLWSALCEGAARDPGCLATIADDLEQRRWTVFRRMALQLLSSDARAAAEAAARRLTDRAVLDNPHLQREAFFLAQAGFTHLPQDARAEFLGIVEDGPSELVGETPAERERCAQEWRLEWLQAAKDHLPAEWEQRREQLIEDYGEPDEIPQPFGEGRTFYGPTSPMDEQELAALAPRELAEYLREWQAPGEWDGPTPEGFGRSVTTLVSQEPEPYAAEAEEFMGLDPTYVRAVLSGMDRAAREGAAISWGPVLSLCEWVLDQPREIAGRSQTGWRDSDPHWGWARKQIAALLDRGVRSREHPVPYEHRQRVWALLQELLRDPDPAPEDEEASGLSPVDLSMNVVRGQAMHAALGFGVWVVRHLGTNTDGGSRGGSWFSKMPGLRDCLEMHLDPVREPSAAVRAVYGMWFNAIFEMDSDWATRHAERVFPHDDSRLFHAAWAGHVGFTRHIARPVFELLAPHYEFAIMSLNEASNQDTKAAWDAEHLASHLAIAYLFGEADLDQSPLSVVFSDGPAWFTGQIFTRVGSYLHPPAKPPEPAAVERAKALWDSRLTAAERGESDALRELRQFGLMFTVEGLDREWALNRIGRLGGLQVPCESRRRVLALLADLAQDCPLEAIRVLEQQFAIDGDQWFFMDADGHAPTILKRGMSEGGAAKDEAVRLANRFVARGYDKYRALLEDKDDEK